MAYAVIGLMLAGPLLGNFYIGDDFDLVRSFYGKDFSYFAGLFADNWSADVWVDNNPAEGTGFIRPLWIFSLALNLGLSADAAPLPFMLFNSLLYVLAAYMLYLLGRALLPGSRFAVFAAGVWFLSQPVNVYLPGWISSRGDSMCLVLMLLSLLCLLPVYKGNTSRLLYVLSLVWFVMALYAKESAALLPFIIAALWWLYDEKPKSPGRAVKMLAPFFTILLAYMGLRYHVFGNFTGGYGIKPEGFLTPAWAWSYFLVFWGYFALEIVWLVPAAIITFRAGSKNIIFGLVWLAGFTALTSIMTRHPGYNLAYHAAGLGLLIMFCLADFKPGRLRSAFVVALIAIVMLNGYRWLESRADLLYCSEVSKQVLYDAQDKLDSSDIARGSTVAFMDLPTLYRGFCIYCWGLDSALAPPFSEKDYNEIYNLKIPTLSERFSLSDDERQQMSCLIWDHNLRSFALTRDCGEYVQPAQGLR